MFSIKQDGPFVSDVVDKFFYFVVTLKKGQHFIFFVKFSQRFFSKKISSFSYIFSSSFCKNAKTSIFVFNPTVRSGSRRLTCF
jgi:hypothetical protein